MSSELLLMLFVVMTSGTLLIVSDTKDYTIYTSSCVSKNDTDVAHCNFNAHQPISLIFGTDIAE